MGQSLVITAINMLFSKLIQYLLSCGLIGLHKIKQHTLNKGSAQQCRNNNLLSLFRICFSFYYRCTFSYPNWLFVFMASVNYTSRCHKVTISRENPAHETAPLFSLSLLILQHILSIEMHDLDVFLTIIQQVVFDKALVVVVWRHFWYTWGTFGQVWFGYPADMVRIFTDHSPR